MGVVYGGVVFVLTEVRRVFVVVVFVRLFHRCLFAGQFVLS